MKKPEIFIIVGMAGSGKSLFAHRLYTWLSTPNSPIDPTTNLNSKIFSVNLDPAVLNLKMPCNEDIRDKIDYQEIMKIHNLGPNGAITTCMNLYLLNVHELISKIKGDVVIFDTPGQLEAFVCNAPGNVLVNALKTISEKIKILYVVDSEKAADPGVFMSNMIYCASLMAKFEVDVVAVFNKIDLGGCDEVVEWITDYDKFRSSLSEDIMVHPTYASLALHFEQFYRNIETVSVSALVGSGKKDFLEKLLGKKEAER